MPRQSSVRTAYHKVGAAGNIRGSSWTKCFACLGVAAVVLALLGMAGTPNTTDRESGRAHHVEKASMNSNSSPDDSYDPSIYPSIGETDVRDAIAGAMDKIETAEKDEMQKEKSMLESTVTAAGGMIRSGIDKLLGGNLDDEEIEEIVSEVEERLRIGFDEDLEAKADQITQNYEDEIENAVDNAERERVSYDTIEKDIWDREDVAVKATRGEIDSAAELLHTNLRGRASQIEKEILEKRLSARFGRPVTIVIGDDLELESLDNLFAGLPSSGGATVSGEAYNGIQNEEHADSDRDPEENSHNSRAPSLSPESDSGSADNSESSFDDPMAETGKENSHTQEEVETKAEISFTDPDIAPKEQKKKGWFSFGK